jgi:putative peptidoglycan lipid II flippase
VWVALLSGTVALMALVRELVVAYYLGAGTYLDAYLLALALPLLLGALFANVFSALVTGRYLGLKTSGAFGEANAFYMSTLLLFFAISLFATLACILVADLLPWAEFLLKRPLREEKLVLTQNALRLLSPVVALTFLAYSLTNYLNLNGRLTEAAITPILVPLMTALACWWGGPATNTTVLALGTLVGFTLQVSLLGIVCHRAGLLFQPAPLEKFNLLSISIIFVLFANFVSASLPFIEQASAARFGEGGVSALYFGTRLGGALVGIALVALGALLTHGLSRAAAEGSNLRRVTFTLQKMVWVGFGLLAIVLAVLSEQVISLFFERGSFDRQAVQLAGNVFRWNALVMPLILVSTLQIRTLVALQDTKAVAYLGLLVFAVVVAGNTWWVPAQGLAGIAQVTFIAQGVGVLAGARLLKLRHPAG